jgi:hypothetical protein
MGAIDPRVKADYVGWRPVGGAQGEGMNMHRRYLLIGALAGSVLGAVASIPALIVGTILGLFVYGMEGPVAIAAKGRNAGIIISFMCLAGAATGASFGLRSAAKKPGAVGHGLRDCIADPDCLLWVIGGGIAAAAMALLSLLAFQYS